MKNHGKILLYTSKNVWYLFDYYIWQNRLKNSKNVCFFACILYSRTSIFFIATITSTRYSGMTSSPYKRFLFWDVVIILCLDCYGQIVHAYVVFKTNETIFMKFSMCWYNGKHICQACECTWVRFPLEAEISHIRKFHKINIWMPPSLSDINHNAKVLMNRF